MTYLLLWLLLYPLVAAAEVYIRASIVEVDVGQISRWQSFVYGTGAVIFLLAYATQ